MGDMTSATLADLDDLITRRVFFGHQSVGGNILDGLRDLLRESGRNWPIAALDDSPARDGGALIHARVGKNEHPLTKCDDFRRIVDEGLAGRVDVAVLKFCYIDVRADADVVALCDRYRATLEDLARRHASTVFVPVTVPLRHAEGGPGVFVREMLGRPNHAKLTNLARQRFNDWLRQGWTISPVFDLAASEATRPDGGRETFSYQGSTGDNLVAAYTDDGGHLNAAGRRAVATDFVRTLATALRARR
jgi:hypothetical protein